MSDQNKKRVVRGGAPSSQNKTVSGNQQSSYSSYGSPPTNSSTTKTGSSSGKTVVRGGRSKSSPRVVRTHVKQTTGKKVAKTAAGVLGTSVKGVFNFILALLLILLITGCIVFSAITIYVMKVVDGETLIDITTLDLSYSSFIYAKNTEGKYRQIEQLKNSENREWVEIDQVPQHVLDAVVYTEDKRFYDHEGVDWKRTIASFANLFVNVYDIRAGGSTITQQLIKNINGDFFERSIEVKINEIVAAMNLERNFTKRQILSAYINYINFGNNIHGIQSASKYYYNKDVSKITVAEAAALAAAIQAPESINIKKDPKANAERRTYTLQAMLDSGAISQKEYDKAMKEKIVVYSKQTTQEGDLTQRQFQSYFVDALIEDVITDLMDAYAYSYEYAKQQLYNGGFKIYSTLDQKVQGRLDWYYADISRLYGYNPGYDHQSAMVIMDHDGNIKALVGGIGAKTGDRVFSRATQSTRSPGSTIKPLSIYAPAFEQDIIYWSYIMDDAPVINLTNASAGPNWPNNYNKQFQGPMTIIDAIRVSKNTIPVRLSKQMTPRFSVDFLQNKLGISTLVTTGHTNDINLAPMSIASLSKGFKLHELTAAYQIFGNGGYYNKPTTYTKVVNTAGKVILQKNKNPKQVISTETSYVMNKALWQVVNTMGASGVEAKLANGMPTVGKTGTSDDRNDLSFVGLSPYYVAGIWYGYDKQKPLPNDASQIRAWAKIMNDVHKGLPVIDFDIPDDNVTQASYCTYSGKLANGRCPSTKIGYYKNSFIPDYCTNH